MITKETILSIYPDAIVSEELSDESSLITIVKSDYTIFMTQYYDDGLILVSVYVANKAITNMSSISESDILHDLKLYVQP